VRFWVTFKTHNSAELPITYTYGLQALLYGLLSRELRDFLHEEGFNHNGRRFKLFTFSRLFGRFVRNGNMLKYRDEIKLCISSPVERFVRELANSLIQRRRLTLLGKELTISSIYFPERPVLRSGMTFKTLSPITVYSTLTTGDGRKKTYYYSPFEEEFSDLVSTNLARKAELITGKEVNGAVSIKPIDKPHEVICLHKGTVIRGWVGRFKIQGDQLLIEAGYEAGLGSKNPAGFGMIEVA